MVDFKKKLATRAVERPVNPEEIYRRLDRASDKGPLRPAQEVVQHIRRYSPCSPRISKKRE